MDFKATGISYAQTHFFSKLVLDYLSECETLRPFYHQVPKPEFLKAALQAKAGQSLDRELLTRVLKQQYEQVETPPLVARNIERLGKPETFSITTAHQPNVLLGPLYFIYKILHAVRLAAYCKERFPGYDFVPVYYMGSEDADLDELGHIHLNTEKLTWSTQQTGAVGRMKIDPEFLQLIHRIEQELGVLPHGSALAAALKQFYAPGESVQNATFAFVNYLFGAYGLVVVIPDHPGFKSIAIDLFEDELHHQRSAGLVEQTVQALEQAGYKPQTQGREINLFYLTEDGARRRIEKVGDHWKVVDSDLSFDAVALTQTLHQHPQRFSPNVILRGLFQEMLLPNIAFIGGGGELAYWLELKALFVHYRVAYPMLVLRNSFLVTTPKQIKKATGLGFTVEDLFKSSLHLKKDWVSRYSDKDFSTSSALTTTDELYESLAAQAGAIDATLKRHVYALKKQQEKKLTELAKKLLRAEKRNHSDAMRQIDQLKNQLFPLGNLQERIESMLPYYATWGPDFIAQLYQHSLALEQHFVILETR